MKKEFQIKLKIFRGTKNKKKAFDVFEVQYEDGASILDALVWVRTNRDCTIDFRYSCINANACKECMVLVDGKVVYACTARLNTGMVTVEPLSNKTLIRDLVTDIVPPKERLDRNS